MKTASTSGGRVVVRIGLVQSACSADRERNVAQALAGVAEAAAAGAEVVCLQELFAGEYPCQAEDHGKFAAAETVPGPLTERLAAAAKQHGVVLVGSVFERRSAGLFHNTAVIFDADGSTTGVYRKMHIPDDPRYFEKFYFTPGDLGWQAVQGRDAKVGMLVCWDQWYPEAARLTALCGAEILFYPTAIGWWHGETPRDRKQQREAWMLMHRAHAIANGIWVAAVNRVGAEDDLQFWGGSILVDPGGEIVLEGSVDREEVLVAEVDTARIEELRRGWPFLRDRRIDAYGGLCRRWGDGGQA